MAEQAHSDLRCFIGVALVRLGPLRSTRGWPSLVPTATSTEDGVDMTRDLVGFFRTPCTWLTSSCAFSWTGTERAPAPGPASASGHTAGCSPPVKSRNLVPTAPAGASASAPSP